MPSKYRHIEAWKCILNAMLKDVVGPDGSPADPHLRNALTAIVTPEVDIIFMALKGGQFL